MPINQLMTLIQPGETVALTLLATGARIMLLAFTAMSTRCRYARSPSTIDTRAGVRNITISASVACNRSLLAIVQI